MSLENFQLTTEQIASLIVEQYDDRVDSTASVSTVFRFSGQKLDVPLRNLAIATLLFPILFGVSHLFGVSQAI